MVKWNFFEMFEELQEKNLSEGNPLMDPLIKTKRKKVCFAIAEMVPTQLPHCRRVEENEEYGHLHSKKCKNYEDLKDYELYNRANVLSILFSTPFSLINKYMIK